MDAITTKRIEKLHPSVRNEMKKIIENCNASLTGKAQVRITQSLRTFEEQDVLYQQGRTKPGKKVTNAKGGQSIHNYGLAFDIVLMYDKDGDGKFEEASWDTKRDGDKDGIADWLEVTKVFTSAGYTNGFITNGKKWDLPHFQKDFGLSWQKMKTKIDKGDYISETINGYTYKYINL